MVLVGSQLKIQIPSMQPTSVSTAGRADSPGLPIEFGVKNKNSQLALLSPAPRSPMSCSVDMWPPSTDMELSEDYTCVIAHGPNPRTTHIFDNCIVESCSTGHNYAPSPRQKRSLAGDSVSFLAFCHVCKKSLGQGKDIFMYRGEKAFCSNECRHHHHEGMEKASRGPSMVL